MCGSFYDTLKLHYFGSQVIRHGPTLPPNMSDDIDTTADALSNVQSNEDLATVEIVDVTEEGHEVCFHLQLPGSPNFEQRFERPPVWGANCDLKRILDAYNLGPDEIEDLIGTQIPVTREVVDGTLNFDIDIEALSSLF